MKFKIKILLPLIIILIMGAYLLINNTDKMNYIIPELIDLEDKEIKNIRIENNSEIFDLRIDKDVWRIGPEQLRAEQSKVLQMLSFIANPKFIDMVSNTENYQNYGLDENFITVSAWTNFEGEGIPTRKLLIGNLNSTGNFTFIRSGNNKSVFTVSGDKQSLFDITKNGLLDKRVVSLDIPKIEKINLSFLDKTHVLTKTVGANGKDSWSNSIGFQVNIDILEQNLRYLSNSRFISYINSNDSNKQNTLFKLELIGEIFKDSFTIFQKYENDFLCNSSLTDKNFLLLENTGTQIIRMFNELIETKE